MDAESQLQELERLERDRVWAERDKALDSRQEWMKKATEFQQEIERLKGLVIERDNWMTPEVSEAKDAEIERLKREKQHAGIECIGYIGELAEAIIEIKRLKLLVSDLTNVLDFLVEAPSEIELMKQSKNILSDLLYKMEAKANNHEKLIIKLCDALEECERFIHTQNHDIAHDPQLIKHAREEVE